VSPARPAFLAAATVITAAGSSAAVEREHQVGLDVGGAALVISDKPSTDLGASLGVHYRYGLSDQFLFMAHAAVSPVAPDERADSPSSPTDRPAGLVEAAAGVAYVLDVLSWVPYGGLLVGGYAFYGGTLGGSPRVLPGVSIALGLDYRLDRTWSVGVSLHQTALSQPGTYPSLTQAFAHVDVNWGW